MKKIIWALPIGAISLLALFTWKYPLSQKGSTSSLGKDPEQLVTVSTSSTTEKIDFATQILPLLSDKCYFCHGPDESNRGADLRLDVRDVALEKGAIVPGHPQKSTLYQRIITDNAKQLMPPKESHKTLKPQEKQLLHD